MPLFAVPLAPSSTTSHSQPTNTRPSHPSIISLPIRKRKRPAREREPQLDSDSDQDADVHAHPSSTNPLSLTPDEIAQYKLAGLQLDEELPRVNGWPHRGLGAGSITVVGRKEDRERKGKEKDADFHDGQEDSGELKKGDADERGSVKGTRAERGPRLRLQHLSVLTTILQRCLLEGDIFRASRAWAMLIRTQVGGRGVDLRGSGYWGIGAELLVRSLERRKNYTYDENIEDGEEEAAAEEENQRVKRWGSKDGLEKAKDYYERLILQHPYKRQFDGSVSALDFWPAMVGCEVYGIQFEHNEELRRIAREEVADQDGKRSESQSEESEVTEDEENVMDATFAADRRRKSRRERRKAEKRWIERDEARKTALIASEKISFRLDDLMATPPYSDNHNLLRLRGMIALYIGDLSVPALPPNEATEHEEDEGAFERCQRPISSDKEIDRRFLYRQRLSDHEHGKQKQKGEYELARKLFDRIAKEGGDVDDIKLPLEQDEEDTEELYDAER
jgi:hypothetical protein